MTKKSLDELTYTVVGACIEVHKQLGAGLLESVYHKCLLQEFKLRKMNYASELVVPVHYKGIDLDAGLRCDFLVENSIVLELKAVETMLPLFEAQLFTYMKLLAVPKGILVNFNCAHLFREGQKTYVNELYRQLPVE